MRRNSRSVPKNPYTALLLVAIVGLVLGELYLTVQEYVGPGYLGPAIVNSVLAVGIVWWRRTSRLFDQRLPPIAFLPAGGIVLGSLSLALCSRLLLPEELPPASHSWDLMPVFWVPIAEELVFRAGIGRYLMGFGSKPLMIYLSALLFGWVHTLPSVSGLLTGSFSMALGPFLLGLITQVLYAYFKDIRPAIGVHMAANSTVILFLWIDPRMLGWLSIFYQGS